jgi:perosamine synthetase
MPSDFIALSEPCLRGREWEYVKDCLDSGWVSSVGGYVTRFEQMVAARSGTKYAVATVNGTAALHICLLVAGVCADEEVLVSDLTFIAPANAVRYLAARPVFIDCEVRHWQMDPSIVAEFLEHRCERRGSGVFNIQTGRRIAAILPVHVLGHPCDMAALGELAAAYDLPIVEDATESLGSLCRGRSTGSFGVAGCISFNGNKILTTGGGGMIVTNDEGFAARARHLTTQAKSEGSEYIHDEVGYNCRLTNVQAAIGCAQMEQLDFHLQAKARIARRYREAFQDHPGFSWQEAAEWAAPNHWLPTLRIDETLAGTDARKILTVLAGHHIQTRPLWQPMHASPAHAGMGFAGGEISRTLFRECLSLPCSVSLTADQQDAVVRVISASLRS